MDTLKEKVCQYAYPDLLKIWQQENETVILRQGEPVARLLCQGQFDYSYSRLQLISVLIILDLSR